jgi:hypothetical protein
MSTETKDDVFGWDQAGWPAERPVTMDDWRDTLVRHTIFRDWLRLALGAVGVILVSVVLGEPDYVKNHLAATAIVLSGVVSVVVCFVRVCQSIRKLDSAEVTEQQLATWKNQANAATYLEACLATRVPLLRGDVLRLNALLSATRLIA